MNIGIGLDWLLADTQKEVKNMDELEVDSLTFLEDPVFYKNLHPNAELWNATNRWFFAAHDIFILSDRKKKFRSLTEQWLYDWSVPCIKLIDGLKPEHLEDQVGQYNIDLILQGNHQLAIEFSSLCPTFYYGQSVPSKSRINEIEYIFRTGLIDEFLQGIKNG